jgi:ABC-type lipopolysaccharide export system ATPase subunit
LAVDAVDLAVRRGSVHGLIGPNGAGKTTLLNLVAECTGQQRGAALWRAGYHRHSTAKRARAGIRRTFQNLKLFGEMTALENVAIGLHAQTRRISSMRSGRRRAIAAKERSIRDRSMAALHFVGLAGVAHARAGRLLWTSPSVGDRPRHRGAAALLLLDEPAAGLNVTEAAHVSEPDCAHPRRRHDRDPGRAPYGRRDARVSTKSRSSTMAADSRTAPPAQIQEASGVSLKPISAGPGRAMLLKLDGVVAGLRRRHLPARRFARGASAARSSR